MGPSLRKLKKKNPRQIGCFLSEKNPKMWVGFRPWTAHPIKNNLSTLIRGTLEANYIGMNLTSTAKLWDLIGHLSQTAE